MTGESNGAGRLTKANLERISQIIGVRRSKLSSPKIAAPPDSWTRLGGEMKTGNLQRCFACQDTSLGSARSSHLASLDLI